MLKMFKKKIILMLLAMPLALTALTPEEVVGEFKKTLHIPNLSGSFKVSLIAQNGDTREIEARAYQKVTSENENSRLFIFDFPPTVRGTGLLVNSYTDGRDNNMWIYLPAIRRVKRIALESSGGGYFMGSDFTYSDLINNDSNKLSFELLDDADLDGESCYIIQAKGKTAEDRQSRGYAFTNSYYRKRDYFMLARDYFDFNGELLKEYRVKGELHFGQFIYPTEIWMTNVQTGHKSILSVTDTSTDEIPDKYFTTRYLQKK